MQVALKKLPILALVVYLICSLLSFKTFAFPKTQNRSTHNKHTTVEKVGVILENAADNNSDPIKTLSALINSFSYTKTALCLTFFSLFNKWVVEWPKTTQGFDAMLRNLKLKPSIIDETIQRFLEKVDNEQAEKITSLKFNPKTKRKVNAIVSDIFSSEKTNNFLPNVLIYGPPGTGKTAMSKSLAKNDRFEVWTIPGTALLNENYFNHLYRWVNSRSQYMNKKVILIVDEAEYFFRLFKNGRSNTVTSFLQKLGTRKKNSMWIFTANQVLDIFRAGDKAIERRFNHKIHIDLPQEELLLTILLYKMKIYIKNNFDQSSEIKIAEHLFKNKENKARYIKLAEKYSPDELEMKAREICNIAYLEKIKINDALIFEFFMQEKTIEDNLKKTLENEKDSFKARLHEDAELAQLEEQIYRSLQPNKEVSEDSSQLKNKQDNLDEK